LTKDLSQGTRLALYFFLLLFTVVYQLRYPLFINSDFLIPIYGLLFISLLVSGVFFLIEGLSEKTQNQALKLLLPLDAIIISLILYKTSLQSSLYLFFYLYLIFVTSLTFQLRGALMMSTFCAFLFSLILFFDASTSSNSKIFLFLMNNLAFFVVAVLSGTLSSQLVVKEKSLQELKNINNLIIENMKTGLLTLNRDFSLIQANQATSEILGDKISKEYKVTSRIQELLEMKEELEQKSIVTKTVFIYGDEKKDVEVLMSKFNLEPHNPAYLVLLQDVTEKRRIEERMKTQEKLAAVGQLAAGMAHEIRNPLASMSGSIQLLAGSFEKLDDEQKRLIAITLKETDRLNALISEFLEFVRPNLPMQDKVDLAKLIRECIEMMQLNKNLLTPTLDLDIEPTKMIQANHDKLKQVFLNILINASHAMEKQQTPLLKISCHQVGSEILIKIQDNGIGMDEKTVKKIFEPFFTTKSRGTGLGLAIAHKILEAHNAQVDVESELNKGTTFKIRFST